MSHPEQTHQSSPTQVVLACGIIAGLVALLVAILALGGGSGIAAPTTDDRRLALLSASFLAGMLSFLAPCPLPLLPGYFAYTFQAFTGTLRGTIDRSNHGPRRLRSQGTLQITDLDADPEQRDCATDGLNQWGGLPVTRLLQ